MAGGAVGELFVTIGADVNPFDRGMGHVQQKMASTATDVQRHGNTITNALGRIGEVAAGFVVANVMTKVASSFAGAAGAVMGFSAQMEQSKIGWTTLLQNGQLAEAMLFDLQKLAATTPFEFADVERGAKRLLAMGFAATDVKGLLIDIGNAAAAMGLGATGIDRVTLAIGQMNAKTKVQAGEMLQLTEAGIPAWEMLAAHMGKSTAEVMKLSEQGKIASSVFVEAFRNFSQQNYGDAMAAQARTFNGAISTIQDSLLIVGSTAFKPLFDAISSLALRFGDFVQSDQFMAWGGKVAAIISTVMDALGALASMFGNALGSILDIVVSVGQAIYEGLQWLNPFATHSPSVVSEVKRGMGEILDTYGDIESIRGPLDRAADAVSRFAEEGKKAASLGMKGMERAAGDLKDVIGTLKDGIRAATDEIRRFAETPLLGTRQFSDQMFDLDMQMAAVQKRINDLRLTMGKPVSPGSGADKGARDAYQAAMDSYRGAFEPLEAELETLRLQADNLRLEERMQLDPLRRQIKDLTSAQEELTFDEITSGITAAQSSIATLTEQLTPAQAAYEQLQVVIQDTRDAMSEQAAAAGGAGAAMGGMAIKAGEAQNKLAGIGEKLAESQQQLQDWKDNFTNTKQSIVDSLTAIRRAVENAIPEPLKSTVAVAGAHLTRLVGAFKQAFTGDIGGALQTAAQSYLRYWQDIIDMASIYLPPMLKKLGEWGAAFVDWIKPRIAPLLAEANKLATRLLDWVRLQVPPLLARIAEWGQALVAWVGPRIAPLLAEANQLAQSFLAWAGQQAAPLLAKLQEWGAQLVTWIGPMIPPLLAEAGQLASQFLAWVGEQTAPILAKLGEWADAFVAWIVPMTVDFLARWPGMLNSFLDWIAGAAGPILVQLGEWAVAFTKWIIPMLPDLLKGLAGVATAVTVFIAETAAVLTAKLVEWGVAFVQWLGPHIPDLLGELLKLQVAMGQWIVTEALPAIVAKLAEWTKAFIAWLPEAVTPLMVEFDKLLDRIGETIGEMATEAWQWMQNVGRQMVEGVLSGLGSLKDRLVDTLRGAFRGAVTGVEDDLMIRSPSKVMAIIGEQMIEGAVLGIGQAAQNFENRFIELLASPITWWKTEFGTFLSYMDERWRLWAGQQAKNLDHLFEEVKYGRASLQDFVGVLENIYGGFRNIIGPLQEMVDLIAAPIFKDFDKQLKRVGDQLAFATREYQSQVDIIKDAIEAKREEMSVTLAAQQSVIDGLKAQIEMQKEAMARQIEAAKSAYQADKDRLADTRDALRDRYEREREHITELIDLRRDAFDDEIDAQNAVIDKIREKIDLEQAPWSGAKSEAKMELESIQKRLNLRERDFALQRLLAGDDQAKRKKIDEQEKAEKDAVRDRIALLRAQIQVAEDSMDTIADRHEAEIKAAEDEKVAIKGRYDAEIENLQAVKAQQEANYKAETTALDAQGKALAAQHEATITQLEAQAEAQEAAHAAELKRLQDEKDAVKARFDEEIDGWERLRQEKEAQYEMDRWKMEANMDAIERQRDAAVKLDGTIQAMLADINAMQSKLAEVSMIGAITNIMQTLRSASIPLSAELLDTFSRLPREAGGLLDKFIAVVQKTYSIPSFDRGGIVPGARGEPQLVIAHGGEEISQPGQSAGRTQIFNLTANYKWQDERELVDDVKLLQLLGSMA